MERRTDHDIANGTFSSYVTGYGLSIVLTLVPFGLVINKMVEGWTLVLVLMTFAVAQLLVQLLFFLHLGKESRPRWNLMAFLFMLLVVLIVVIGSLWIMNSLNYHMSDPSMAEPLDVSEQSGF